MCVCYSEHCSKFDQLIFSGFAKKTTATKKCPPLTSHHLNFLSQQSSNFCCPQAFSVTTGWGWSRSGWGIRWGTCSCVQRQPTLIGLIHFIQTHCKVRRSHFPFVQPVKWRHFENMLPMLSVHAYFVFQQGIVLLPTDSVVCSAWSHQLCLWSRFTRFIGVQSSVYWLEHVHTHTHKTCASWWCLWWKFGTSKSDFMHNLCTDVLTWEHCISNTLSPVLHLIVTHVNICSSCSCFCSEFINGDLYNSHSQKNWMLYTSTVSIFAFIWSWPAPILVMNAIQHTHGSIFFFF